MQIVEAVIGFGVNVVMNLCVVSGDDKRNSLDENRQVLGATCYQ